MIELKTNFEIRDFGHLESNPDLLYSNAKIVGAIVSYLGTGYSGFAYQAGQRTIAGELIRAMAICIGVEPKLVVAGRTDAGVHARAQVVSFVVDDGSRFSPERFVRSMNSLLDPQISVRVAWIADNSFHARHSARYRKYVYRFAFGETPDPFIGPTSWLVRDDLNLSSMSQGASYLLGEHDFSSFCRRDPNGASLVRRVDDISFEEHDSGVDLWVVASSFCHQMVRAISGLLYQVGSGKVEPDYVEKVVNGRDRSLVRLMAPASGLTLWEVGYDEGVLPQWK